MLQTQAGVPPPLPAVRNAPHVFHAHQKEAWAYATRQAHPALWMDMRLGKSAVAIRTIGGAYHGAGPHRTLIVAPNSALPGWANELGTEGIAANHITWLTGPRKGRLANLHNPSAWNLINTEGWRALPEIATVPWFAVVLDESTAIKNPRTKITHFFLRHFRAVPHRWSLTGTPAPESDLEFWPQLAWLDGHAFGHRSYWGWLTAAWQHSPVGYGWTPKRGTQTAVREEISKRAFILNRKDVPGMGGAKVYERRTITMPPRVRALYRRIEKEWLLPSGRETKTAAVTYHWLRQLCGGYAGEEADAHTWDGKVKELMGLLRGELARDPVVVWFYYNRELVGAHRVLTAAGVDAAPIWGGMPARERGTRAASFQNGAGRVLLVQQACAQMGANFSRADTAIYYSTPLGALARQQTEDRVVDVARSTPHLIIDLTVQNTVDEDAVDLVREKGARGAWTLQRARQLAQARVGVRV